MANALLGAITNPAQVDVLGSLDKGKERRGRELAGQILGQTQFGQLGALLETSPELGLKVMESQGIPANSTEMFNHWKGAVVTAGQFAAGGDLETAAAIVDDFVSKTQAATGGEVLAEKAQAMAQRLRAGDPTAAQELAGLAGALTQQPSAKLPAEAVAFNDLIKDFTPEQQKTAKLVKAGLKGRAMSNAVLSAIESGDVKNLADAKAQIKQAETFASATGSSRAKFIDAGANKIQSITKNILNIDKAISALDAGAGTGAIEKFFPSIKAASVELNNIQGELALDVVGATTFGALSKGELDLARSIAVPTGLDGPELKDFLLRKKASQQKLMAYFEEQIEFLEIGNDGKGGTIAGFIRMKKREQGNNQPTAATGAKFLGFE